MATACRATRAPTRAPKASRVVVVRACLRGVGALPERSLCRAVQRKLAKRLFAKRTLRTTHFARYALCALRNFALRILRSAKE